MITLLSIWKYYNSTNVFRYEIESASTVILHCKEAGEAGDELSGESSFAGDVIIDGQSLKQNFQLYRRKIDRVKSYIEPSTLSVRKYLEFYMHLRRIKVRIGMTRIEDLFEDLKLTCITNVGMKELDGHMRKLVRVAAAYAYVPGLLLIEDPITENFHLIEPMMTLIEKMNMNDIQVVLLVSEKYRDQFGSLFDTDRYSIYDY